jgi:antitoxin YefM
MKTINATDAKKKLLELIREADESFERYCIVRNGEPKAVLMSIEDYEGWLETLEVLSDKETIKEIKKARAELDKGKGIAFEKVLEKLSDKV